MRRYSRAKESSKVLGQITPFSGFCPGVKPRCVNQLRGTTTQPPRQPARRRCLRVVHMLVPVSVPTHRGGWLFLSRFATSPATCGSHGHTDWTVTPSHRPRRSTDLHTPSLSPSLRTLSYTLLSLARPHSPTQGAVVQYAPGGVPSMHGVPSMRAQQSRTPSDV